jgi:hypothetical protein
MVSDVIRTLYEKIDDKVTTITPSLTRLASTCDAILYQAPLLYSIDTVINNKNNSEVATDQLKALLKALQTSVVTSQSVAFLLDTIKSNLGNVNICNECGQPVESNKEKLS